MDAYREGGELDACTLGCDNQVPFAIEEHSKVGSIFVQSLFMIMI